MHIYLMQRSKKLFLLALLVFQSFVSPHLYAQTQTCPQPTIQSSVTGTICKGDEVTLTATFTPGPAPTDVEYQWLFGGDELENATSATLTFLAADSLEGQFTVRVTGTDPDNPCNAAVSPAYTLELGVKAGLRQGKDPGTPQTPLTCLNHIFYAQDTTSGANLTIREWLVNKYREQPVAGQLPATAQALFPVPPANFFTSDSIRIEFSESGVYEIKLVRGSTLCPNDTASTVAKVGYPIVTMPGSQQQCSLNPVRITLNSQILPRNGQPDPSAVAVDQNFGTVDRSTLQWTVTGGDGFTFSSTTPNLDVTLAPSRNRYTIKFSVANECGNVEQYPEEFRENTMDIFIYPVPDPPTFAGPVPPVCDGELARVQPTGPLATGSRGIYWLYQDPTGGQRIGIGNPTNPITIGPLQATGTNAPTTYTFYASTMNEFGCESDTRTPVQVQVLPGVSNNTISHNAAAACGGLTPAPITGSIPQGGQGDGSYTYAWQRSVTSATAGFQVAPGAATAQEYTFTGPLTQTTWFRRIVRSGNCARDTSNVVEVIVVPAITNNTITANQQICAGETPADLTGSLPAGGVPGDLTYRWESSSQGATAGFTAAPGDNLAQNYTFPGPLTETAWYRRVVLSGGCEVPSTPVQVSVTPLIANNDIFEEQTLCPDQPAAPLAGSTPQNAGPTPGFIWESSVQGPLTGFRPVPTAGDTRDYSPGVLPQTTWFRRIVLSPNACRPDTSDAVQITVIPEIGDNRIGADQTVCTGTAPEPLREVIPSGGRNFTYRWEVSTTSAELGFGPAPGTNNAADYSPGPINQETWFRRVIISQGCSNISNAVRLQVIEIPPAPLVGASVTGCPGGRATLTATSADGNVIEWFTQETGGNPVFVGPSFQTPALTATATYYVQATNANNCVSPTRSAATATVTTPEAVISEDVEIIQGRTTELRASGGVTYEWSPAAGLDNPNIATPIARPERTTTYTVTITTELGCVVTEQVTVTVVPALDVPNAFTPNRDGVNEVWEIGNIRNYPEVVVEVFNRWGQRIYRSEGYPEPWDGRLNGQDLPVATYYYIIYLNRQEVPISGSVTIIR
ncbi:hypothetical protein BH24BAC1_BH24BAC1_02560 [soil metagenome]